MNVSLRHLIAFWFLLFYSISMNAQDRILDTYRGQKVTFEPITSLNFFPAPDVTQPPVNGVFDIVPLGDENYRLEYTPNLNFIGSEVVMYTRWEAPAQLVTETVYINVLKSQVTTNQDFTGTNAGISVDIDALTNDSTTSGPLTISQISLVNNGTVEISEDGQILNFTPEADFTGITHFNYIACDEFGSCDQGTVSVSVYDPNGTNPDTIRVFTKKNRPQSVFIPYNFNLSIPPLNGTFDSNGDLPRYFPDINFIGTDYLSFEDDGQIKVVEIKVLDLLDNSFAFDDDVFTTSYSPVEFNVFKNDLYGINAGCLQFSQPRYGTLELIEGEEGGTFKYTPIAGFTGIDQFTYTSQNADCTLPAETATAYIYVSNFEPAYSKFRMSTVKRTPLIVAYSIPIDGFYFDVSAQATMGDVVFLPGSSDTTIYGRNIRGYNLLVYVPDEGVAEGMDEFEIKYCVFEGDVCQYQKFIKIEMDILNIGDEEDEICIDDCVWPGDTNLDGVVDIKDLLPIGLYMGESGSPRSENDLGAWFGEYGNDWGITNNNQADIKHVDSNGDSTITAIDTAAIRENYGRTHSLTPASLPNVKNRILLMGSNNAGLGDVIEFDVFLGTEQTPAEDVYGFSFPIQYNPAFFDPEKVAITFNTDSWLSYSSPVLSMTNNNKNGLLEAALTRTNGKAASGFGAIGKMRVVITDDIIGFRPGDKEVKVTIGGNSLGSAMNSMGQTTGVSVEGIEITIDLTKPTAEELEADTHEIHEQLIKVYPNPAYNQLNVHFNGSRTFNRVLLSNISGQTIFDSGTLDSSRETIDISQYTPGMYFLSIQTEKGVVTKKVEIID